MRRLLHPLGAYGGDEPAAGEGAELRLRQVGAGVDPDHTGRRPGLFEGDFRDRGMRVRRANESCVRLVRQGHVVGVLSRAGQEAVILLALDARADQRSIHIFPPIACAPAMMLLTMLW